MKSDSDVIIIGAGLAGLTAARYLQSAGISTVIIEGNDRPGGRVKSDSIDGFTLDHGFQVFNPSYRHLKNSGLLPRLGFTPMVSGLIPFRIVGEVRTSKDLFEPFLKGVFLSDPKSVSPVVRREIYKSFLKARPGLVDGGASAFSRAYAEPLMDIHYNETVHRIEGNLVITDDAQYSAEMIIVATDPVTATQLVSEIDVVMMNSSTTWYHATSDRVEGAGRFAVVKDGPLINSVAISDMKKSYSTSGDQLFSTTTLSVISESEVRRELSRIWKCDTSRWEFVAQYEIKQSLPSHPAGKPLYSPVEIKPGLFVVGDHRGYPSQQGAMESGALAAKQIIERVHPRHW